MKISYTLLFFFALIIAVENALSSNKVNKKKIKFYCLKNKNKIFFFKFNFDCNSNEDYFYQTLNNNKIIVIFKKCKNDNSKIIMFDSNITENSSYSIENIFHSPNKVNSLKHLMEYFIDLKTFRLFLQIARVQLI